MDILVLLFQSAFTEHFVLAKVSRRLGYNNFHLGAYLRAPSTMSEVAFPNQAQRTNYWMTLIRCPLSPRFIRSKLPPTCSPSPFLHETFP